MNPTLKFSCKGGLEFTMHFNSYKAYSLETETGKYLFRFEALGTNWEIESSVPLSIRIQQDILEQMDQFNRTYSRFQSDSLVSQIAAASEGGRFIFPDDALILFDLYDRLYSVTQGAVDPLVGKDLELLGYDSNYSLIPASDSVRAETHVHGRANWAENISRNGTTLITDRPLSLDFGAAGKGYFVDIVSTLLLEAGIDEFVVDGSGDLRHRGGSSIQVGLEHPFDSTMVIGVAELCNGSLCASAINRRAWGDELHHILDARTGVPTQNVVATWVIANDTLTADGLATALFFSPGKVLEEYFCFSYVRMFSDGHAEMSLNFGGELFI
jgi:thiamine biosynthesis lipoprotein